MRAVFEQFAAQKDLVRWGDKSIEYNHHLDVLLELFPTAQFVHVVRDARDVAVSVFKMAFGPKSAYEAAVDWRRTVNRIQDSGARLPARQYVDFRYEDLIEDPFLTLDRIATFLGIANHATLLEGRADRLREQVRRGNSGRWKTGLSPREVACIEAVAGLELTRFGYQLQSSPDEPRKIAVGQIALWKAQGFVRRVLNRAYWSDGAYRLVLRLRDVPSLFRAALRH